MEESKPTSICGATLPAMKYKGWFVFLTNRYQPNHLPGEEVEVEVARCIRPRDHDGKHMAENVKITGFTKVEWK